MPVDVLAPEAVAVLTTVADAEPSLVVPHGQTSDHVSDQRPPLAWVART